MKKTLNTPKPNATLRTIWYAALFAAAVASPDVMATGAGGSFTETGDTVCGFFTNINSLLNIASIAVVTIAVIFAGYQIAFAHKRIADVAPILIGGLLIGAAGQIAKMLLGDDAGGSCTAVSALWQASSVMSV
jgi:type IV secretion system protein VirB2